MDGASRGIQTRAIPTETLEVYRMSEAQAPAAVASHGAPPPPPSEAVQALDRLEGLRGRGGNRPRYACLWQHLEAGGRRIQFFHYRTYQLCAYGLPPFTPRGDLHGALNDRGRSITLRP
jgi:hypothetical protein